MKKIISILFVLICNVSFSQVFIVQFDTISFITCSSSLKFNDMVDEKSYDIIKTISDPSIMIIHLDMMLIFGKNGETPITEVIEKYKFIDIICGENKTHLTIKQNVNGLLDMVIEDFQPKLNKKELCYFSDVKFLK
jgi:hypothetical protein